MTDELWAWKSYLKGFFDVHGEKMQIIVTGSAKMDVYKRGGGSFKVAITGIVETVEAGVAASAVERLTSATATTIAVPAGLYYSITPSTALPISGTAEKGLSTGGTVTIDKPGTTAGFYEIKVSATPIQ